MPSSDTSKPTISSLTPSPHTSQNKPSTLPQTIRIRNRRKRYLETHPSYFGPSLESADPLLYDRLIRTHQTTAERTSERTAKGFAGTLEADLLRSEAKLDEVRGRRGGQGQGQGLSFASSGDGDGDGQGDVRDGLRRDGRGVTRDGHPNGNGNGNANANTNRINGHFIPPSQLPPLPVPPNQYTTLTRDEAYQQWIETMSTRFVRGEDEDFEYDTIDRDEGLDDARGEERDREEEWFDGEDEGFIGGGGSGSDGSDGDGDDGRGREGKGRELKGETGVQDF